MTAATGAPSAPPAPPRWLRGDTLGRFAYVAFCTLVFVFLVAPIVVIVPLSFNAEPYFTFTEGMLRFDPEAYSLRWYREILDNELWTRSLVNSLVIGVSATALATTLGTLAALGLASAAMPARRLVMGLLISPMITPVIISAAGMFFFYSSIGLGQTHLGLILAHTALGIPFVVITVTATLSGFDRNLTRAAASLGATPLHAFRKVQLPLIAPGVISGALFAFATSFDEVVVVLFMAGVEQRTIPRQMWAGIREQISPAILAVATFLIVFAGLLLVTVAWLRRRGRG
ncbi:MAG: ABC transporter permease [Gemmatimonadetes bacterium]|nr:ABC transporter permease [Gemmatimonadota bacterium]MYA65205.1 ABC transporter permease [Gemmatimonadota bacterium]MYB99809.1 ABC transporter permease [Gemmatimonadota bacterium]MYH53231.1 ABC transporter permease [Gemmatimonadota bacterium]MYK67198.1 ABC transporter permease [Gemmatimonadota bacterium]